MNNALFSYPKPSNEPSRDYAPGSEDRKLLKEAISEISSNVVEIPLIIGGKEVITGDTMTLIHQFCDNELSSFYIDVSKDKLYADAEHARVRRSIRTVMWETLCAVTRMMSPVLSYTAEEIWQNMREMDPSLPESVFLSDWPGVLNEGVDPSTEDLWDSVIDARQGVLRGLEAARRLGVIGHPLDAEVQIKLGERYAKLAGLIDEETWENVLIVSSCSTVDDVRAEVVHEDETTGLTVGVSRSSDEKCPRCWKRRPEVAAEGLCRRCRDVLEEQRRG